MNVLITGSNGFIGRALCKRMVPERHRVRGAIRDTTKKMSLPAGVEEVQVGNIGGQTDWSRALDGIEVIVHLAARVHVMNVNKADSIIAYREVNVTGTERLAQQAIIASVKRLVYISSVKVHGEGGAVPYTERDTPDPQDPYAISKCEAEQVLCKVAANKKIEIVILRLPLVYGAGVKANFLSLLKFVKQGVPLPLASIKNRRSLIYVGNLVDAILVCLSHRDASGETFLVSDGKDLSTPELIRMMAGSMGIEARLFSCPTSLLRLVGKLSHRSAEVDRLIGSLCIDSSKIRSMLGWEPPFTVEEGIRKTCADYAA